MKETSKFRERYNRWKNGENYWEIRADLDLPKFQSGKDDNVYEMSPTFDQYVNLVDNTRTTKPTIVKPVKVVKPPFVPKVAYLNADYRSESKRALDQLVAAKMYAAHRRRLDDQIRELGIQDLMKLTMPSTYVQAAVGQELPELANFAIDMVGFGGLSNASKIVRGVNKIGSIAKPIKIPAMSSITLSFDNMYRSNIDNAGKKLLAELDLIHPVPGFSTGQPAQVSNSTREIFLNSVSPRLQKMRSGPNVPLVKYDIDRTLDRGHYVYPESTFKIAGKENIAGFADRNTDHIAIRRGLEDFAEGHEYRHRLDYHRPLVKQEEDYLDNAFGEEFKNLSNVYERYKGYDMIPERVTTNYDARLLLLGANKLKTWPVSHLNLVIDKMSDLLILDALKSSNGYGLRYVQYMNDNNLWTPSRINAHRNAMKYVGAMSIPITLGSNIKQYTQNELRNK